MATANGSTTTSSSVTASRSTPWASVPYRKGALAALISAAVDPSNAEFVWGRFERGFPAEAGGQSKANAVALATAKLVAGHATCWFCGKGVTASTEAHALVEKELKKKAPNYGVLADTVCACVKQGLLMSRDYIPDWNKPDVLRGILKMCDAGTLAPGTPIYGECCVTCDVPFDVYAIVVASQVRRYGSERPVHRLKHCYQCWRKETEARQAEAPALPAGPAMPKAPAAVNNGALPQAPKPAPAKKPRALRPPSEDGPASPETISARKGESVTLR